MIKFWKFLSVSIVVAVCLGLLLVPAAGISAEPPADKATFQLPAEVRVFPDEAFTVNVTIWNPHNLVMSAAGTDLMISDASKLNVTAIDSGDWPTWFSPGWDNATGESWTNAGGSLAQPTLNSTYVRQCTIHFVAGSEEGIVTVNFNPSSENGETLIYDLTVDDICDWTPNDMQNMTVIITGNQTLWVNVTPNGSGEVDISGASIPPYYPNTTEWSPGANVTLTAIPAADWIFSNWSGNLTGSTNPDTITMDSDKSVTANFIPADWGKCGPIDLVMLLDDTGSMGGALNNIKAALSSIVDDAYVVSGGDLRMGYITFKDNVTVHNALTDNTTAVMDSINATVASGGAGIPEASDEAKNTAVNNLPGGIRADSAGYNGTQTGNFTIPYRSGALKIVILITDAPPGGFNDVEDPEDDAAMHTHALTAKGKGILISDIFVPTGGDAGIAAILKDDADTSGGVYIEVAADGTGTADAIKDIIARCGVPPAIGFSPTSLSFTTTEGENPADKTLEVWNSGNGTLNWNVTDDAAWLDESPRDGSSTGEHDSVTVSVDVTGLAVGDYNATINITAPAASNTPQSVPVSLAIAAEVEIPEEPELPVIPVEPASLSASSLDITPQQVQPGQDVTISINVANTGGETGSYNAVLYINSVVEDSQTVSVAGGTSKNVIFTVSKSQAGVYDVSVAGQNGQFEVVGGGWFGGGLGTGGIIAIVVVVIILIVAVIFIMRGTAREI